MGMWVTVRRKDLRCPAQINPKPKLDHLSGDLAGCADHGIKSMPHFQGLAGEATMLIIAVPLTLGRAG